jgi:hypothetical protein
VVMTLGTSRSGAGHQAASFSSVRTISTRGRLRFVAAARIRLPWSRQKPASPRSPPAAVLRERWPLHDVRPLAIKCAHEIAVAMGWSFPYTHGVLQRWKKGTAYCRAVLCCDHGIALDGTPAKPVDADAKEMATKQLERLAAREKAAETAKLASAPPPTPSCIASLGLTVLHGRPPRSPFELRLVRHLSAQAASGSSKRNQGKARAAACGNGNIFSEATVALWGTCPGEAIRSRL